MFIVSKNLTLVSIKTAASNPYLSKLEKNTKNLSASVNGLTAYSLAFATPSSYI
jgi:hypothetical protein